MNCPKCNAPNDEDARFCCECGGPTDAMPQKQPGKGRKAYLYALLFLPVLALAAGIGYYKYILPGDTAAIVNGEQVLLSELDAAVTELTGRTGAADPGLRYQVLNGLITERMVLQEARKAGFTVSREDVAAAAAEARRASGMNDTDFDRNLESRYGSMRTYESVLARRLLVNMFLREKVIPRGADARSAGLVMNRWLQDLSGKAAVRITLAEQLSGAAGSCGCCNKRAEAGEPSAGKQPAGLIAKADSSRSSAGRSAEEEKASAAALGYWKEKHGDEAVTASVKNFGCHMEVDIIKDNNTVGSLRYQRGRIVEL